MTTDDVREIYEMRVLLEPFALEKAVPRMDENDRGLLRSLLEDADDAAEKVDLYGLSALNRKFHDALVARCGNKCIIETMDKVQDQLRAISLRAWMPKPIYLREAEQHRGWRRPWSLATSIVPPICCGCTSWVSRSNSSGRWSTNT